MSNGTVTMDNNTAAPQKIKQRKTVRSSDSTSGCEPETMEGRVLERESYTDAHAQQPTRSNNQPVHGGPNGETNAVGVYNGVLASKRKAAATHATAWMRPESTTLREISQTQKGW